jgi:multisubunit Na+/H+ antiporter MnhB subunit
MNSVILKTATRLLAGIVLVFAIYLLWRGHHAPGGGFIAALVAATGFALVSLSEGPNAVRRGIVLPPQWLVGIGMGLAIFAGLPAIRHGLPYLSGVWWPPGDAWVGSPILFDLGVFLVVLGAILTVLLGLEEA